MAAVIGSVAAVNDILESDEGDDLEDITTSPAIQSFFNIHLLRWKLFLKKVILFVFSNLMTVL